MGKRCPYTRIKIDKSVIWLPLESEDEESKINLLRKINFETYYRIKTYWVNQQSYIYYVVEDELFNWIKENTNSIKIVVSAKIQRSPEKAWIHPKSEHDISKMLEITEDNDYVGAFILFKDKNTCAKFKMLCT